MLCCLYPNKKDVLCSVEPIIVAIENYGGEARIVGGCIRDLFLKIPFHDIDLATTLLPEQVLEALKLHSIKAFQIGKGKKHGTVVALLNKKNFDITTLRRDIECDGRHAKTEFTDSWREDALRRDFTFNALYMDKSGHIYDYFDGLKDLEINRIRFIGNAEDRIKEDYLRILRVFRFHAMLNARNKDAEIDDETLKICSQYAFKIREISGDRIREEFFKILSYNTSFSTLEIMKKAGILCKIIPASISSPPFIETGEITHIAEEVDYMILKENGRLLTNDPLIKLVLLIRSIRSSKSEIFKFLLGEEISRILGLSHKQERKLLSFLTIGSSDLTLDLSEKKQKKMILMSKEGYCDCMQICYVETTYQQRLRGLELESQNYEKMTLLFDFANKLQIPKFPLSGRDLINREYTPGKYLGEVLRLLRDHGQDHWLDSGFSLTKDELLVGLESRNKSKKSS